MSSKHPIPDVALDDRLFFAGTAGSGKTYNAMGRVERLLRKNARVVIPDPLGVWWGLRLKPDGKTPSGYDVVIFGGPHGDLPLGPHHGALIGETVAGMKESCILDLSELGTKNAEKRFMLAFLTALYKHATKEPLHVVFDEADMWSPQRLLDKEGEAAKLLGMMETVVRRGRVRGFIPWLISQRPAVISKDVLSQVDGLVAFKLTSSQDRDAIGDWVQGQADKQQWKDLWAKLPTMERGQGVVWVPGRGILETVQFPVKETFDSSRTPKRGERLQAAELRPLDVVALRGKLAKVEEEKKANDPAALRAETAKLRAEKSALEQQMKRAVAQKIVPDPAATEKAEARGFKRGLAFGTARGELEGYVEATKLFDAAIDKLRATQERANDRIGTLTTAWDAAGKAQSVGAYAQPLPTPAAKPRLAAVPRAAPLPAGDGTLPGPEQRILNSLASWAAMGHHQPTNAQVAWLANYSPTSTSYTNPRGALNTKGLISYPSSGRIALTPEGVALASPIEMNGSLAEHVLALLPGPEQRILSAVMAKYPDATTNEEAAEGANYSHTSTSYTNPRGALKTKELITYPASGQLRAADWLFS